MKIRLLFAFLSLIFFTSCSKTAKETITYRQTISDSLQKASISKNNPNTKKIQFKVEKVDSLITYLSPDNGHEPRFKKMQKEYHINDTFKGTFVELDNGYTYSKSTSTVHKRMELNNEYDMYGHVIKTIEEEFVNIQLEGGRSKKNTIQIFSMATDKKMKTPKYEVTAYGNSLKIYEQEGYFLAIEYGCCTSTSTYHLFDLKGNSLFKTNDIIKSISTEKNHYLISALKLEVYDAPTIVVQNKNNERQYISIFNFDDKMNYAENYYLKFNNENMPRTGYYDIPLANYHLKNLDDLEIWIPFGEVDTLKIPFKNEKAFGIDYPQLKVELVDKK